MRRSLPLLIALGLQGLILLVALCIGITRPAAKEEPQFSGGTAGVSQPENRASPSSAQTRQRVKRAADSASVLATESLLSEWQLPVSTSLAPPDTSDFSEGMDAADFGAGGGPGAALPDLPEIKGAAFEFMGLTDAAERIVVCLDISASVKTKLEATGRTMDTVRAETLSLVDGFNANTMVGLIQFSRKYDCFREHLVAGTVKHRGDLSAWLNQRFRTNGTSGSGWVSRQPNGIQSVLEAAFAMDPDLDLVIILSDGDFQRTPPGGGGVDVSWREIGETLKRLQSARVRPVRVQLIAVAMPDDLERDARRVLRDHGGDVRPIDGPQD